MVKVFEGTTEEFYMDGYLKTNLDKAREIARKDWDMIFLVDGFEGVGKSVFGQQCAKYCDPSLIMNRICFGSKDFENKVKSAGKYESVVYDEAYGGLSAKSWMKRVNQSLVKMLTEIRYKNLFIFIILPSFFDLVRYVSIWRSRALLHVYDVDFQRGYFAFYDKDKKKELYIKGKKFYSYSSKIVKPNFIGRFTNHYVVNAEEYKEKKRKHAETVEIEEKKVDKYHERDVMIKRMVDLGYKYDKIGEVSDLTKARISQIVSKTEKT